MGRTIDPSDSQGSRFVRNLNRLIDSNRPEVEVDADETLKIRFPRRNGVNVIPVVGVLSNRPAQQR